MSHIKLIHIEKGCRSQSMNALLTDAHKIRCFQKIINILAKAGCDFIIVIWNDSVSIRSINKSQSTLPIVQFKTGFFDAFSFSHFNSEFVFEIPSTCFKCMLKSLILPQSIKWNVDPKQFICTFNCLDCYDINHHWTFGISETVLFNAVVDMDEVTTSINCRCDVFEGIEKAFQGSQMVSLIIFAKGSRRHHAVLQTQDLNSCDVLSSILRIENGEKCEIASSDSDSNTITCENDENKKCGYKYNHVKKSKEISFILSDFFIGIKICEILSQRAAIYCTAPGKPVVMKAAIPNTVYFEMAMATSAERDGSEDDDSEDEWCDGKGSIKRKGETETKYERDRNESAPILYVPDTSCAAPSSTRIRAQKTH